MMVHQEDEEEWARRTMMVATFVARAEMLIIRWAALAAQFFWNGYNVFSNFIYSNNHIM